MPVITSAIDSGDGVFIERGRPSTAFKPMPHISTYGGSYFSAGQISWVDRINNDFVADDLSLRSMQSDEDTIASPDSDDILIGYSGGEDMFSEGCAKGIVHHQYRLAGSVGPGGDDFWTTEMISTLKSDALTNCHPEGFSEVEIHFIAQLQEACANGTFLTEGIQSYHEIEPDLVNSMAALSEVLA